jgi:type II secretory pathway predicted ATPase ExeA
MYEDYFGLSRPPFKISPDTSLFFEGGNRGDILGALVYAIHRGEGIIKVVGEVGSGKTMLCRMLQLKLPKSVEIIYIANPSVSAEDILFVIAYELELPTTKDASKHEVVNMLHDYLLQRHIENKQVVLFIEEAQGMPLDTLEEIRLLSNLETDQHKLLQIILFGQPELDENLSKKSIRQLRERITHSFDLSPLTHNEIHKYLNFRMREVGYTGPELITSSLAKKVAQYSGGLLRRINIIGDKILLSAFAEGTHNLTSKHVIAAVDDSAFGEDEMRNNSNMIWWLALPILFALAFAIYQNQPLFVGVLAKLGVEPVFLVEKQATEVDKPAKIEKPVTEKEDNREDTGAQMANTVPGKTVGIAGPETVDTAVVDTAVVDTAVVDTAVVDTAVVDTVAVDTAVVDTVVVDTVAVDTAVVDTVAVDTEMVDTAAVDTVMLTVVAESEQAVPEQKAVVVVDTGKQIDKIDDSENIQSKTAKAEAVEDTQNNDVKQAIDETMPTYHRWLNDKLKQSREWLINAQRNNISIQVLMSNKSSERELVYYLQNEWPLSLDKTYLYEVNMNSRMIYRVFYSEFESLAQGRDEMQRLPESVKANSPYLHSVYRMQKALL